MKQIKFLQIAIIKTLILNFRALPWRQAIKLPIVIYDKKYKLTSIGKIRINTKVQYNLIEIGKGFFSNIGQGEIMNSGTIIFNGRCSILRGAIINNQGTIELGNNSLIGENLKVIIRSKLTIGKMSRLPFDSIIMDSSGHPVLNMETKTVNRFTKPIHIGDYCWIGNSSTINGGTILPDHTIVTNRSMLNKDYTYLEKYSLIGGTPAKLIKNGQLEINKIPIWFSLLKKFDEDPNLSSINISKEIMNYTLEDLSNY